MAAALGFLADAHDVRDPASALLTGCIEQAAVIIVAPIT
jgi:hypothetical protein